MNNYTYCSVQDTIGGCSDSARGECSNESSSSSPSNRLAICDRSEWLKSGPDIADWAYSCHHHHSCSTITSILSNIIIKYIVILNHIPHHHVPLYHLHINIALLTGHVFSRWGKQKERTIIKIISISDIIIMIMSLFFITILVGMFPPSGDAKKRQNVCCAHVSSGASFRVSRDSRLKKGFL